MPSPHLELCRGHLALGSLHTPITHPGSAVGDVRGTRGALGSVHLAHDLCPLPSAPLCAQEAGPVGCGLTLPLCQATPESLGIE